MEDLRPPRSESCYRGYYYDGRVVEEEELEFFIGREHKNSHLPLSVVTAHNQRVIDHMSRIRRDKRWREREMKRDLLTEKVQRIRETISRGNHPQFARIRRDILAMLAEMDELLVPPAKERKKGRQLSLGAEDTVETSE